MTSHELAKVLLANDDLPVSLNVFGHIYSSIYDRGSHGPLKIIQGNNNYGTLTMTICGSARDNDLKDGKIVFSDLTMHEFFVEEERKKRKSIL